MFFKPNTETLTTANVVHVMNSEGAKLSLVQIKNAGEATEQINVTLDPGGWQRVQKYENVSAAMVFTLLHDLLS